MRWASRWWGSMACYCFGLCSTSRSFIENTNCPGSSSSSSSSLGPVSLCPGYTSVLGLLYNPKYSNQYRFSNPVPLIKRQRSLTEAVLISFRSTNGVQGVRLALNFTWNSCWNYANRGDQVICTNIMNWTQRYGCFLSVSSLVSAVQLLTESILLSTLKFLYKSCLSHGPNLTSKSAWILNLWTACKTPVKYYKELDSKIL